MRFPFCGSLLTLFVAASACGGPEDEASPAPADASAELAATAPPSLAAAELRRQEAARAPEPEAAAPSLADAHEIVVQTLDEGGMPLAGVPVGWSADAEHARSRAEAVLSSGLSGTARIRLPPEDDGVRRWIHALVLAPEPLRVAVPDGDLGEEPLRLVVPPVGGIRVEVDLPASGALRASLTSVAADSSRPSFRFGSRPTQWRAIGPDGALFEAVALGLPVEVQLWSEQGGGHHVRRFDGPVAPGQIVVCRVSEEGFPALAGRVLDEAGVPTADAWYRVVLRSSSARRSTRLLTDAEGRFRIELEETSGWESLSLLPWIAGRSAGFSDEDEEDPSRWIHQPLPPEVHERLDLGDLQLGPAPLLAAGRVTDRSGAPVPGIQLQVQSRMMQRADGEDLYFELDRARATSDADGAFRIYGEAPKEPVRLTAFSPEHLPPPPLPFLAGDSRLALTIHRAGSLTGSVVFPPGLERIGIVVSLHPPPAGTRCEADVIPNREGRGSFLWRPLPPGLYEVRFQIGSGYEPFHVVPGVLVEAGAPPADPRLRDVRLEDHLRLAELRLRTADGSPVPERAMLYTIAPGGRGAHGKGLVPKEGVVRLLCRPEAPADVAIAADGFLTLMLPGFSGSGEAWLTPAFDLIVRVSGSEPLRNEFGDFVLHAQWFEADGSPALLAHSARDDGLYILGEGRESALPVSRPVELRLTWRIPGADGTWRSVEAARAAVHADDAGRVLTVAPPVPR